MIETQPVEEDHDIQYKALKQLLNGPTPETELFPRSKLLFQSQFLRNEFRL